MPDIEDGDVVYVQGSAREPYELRNVGGVYSCSCPAWRNAGGPIDRRTCKHLKAQRGVEAETERLGADVGPAPKAKSDGEGGDANAPPVLLAHRWEPHVDLTGWWMSEKLDGVRAYWDGARFVSRLGNPFFAPAWFTAGFPSEPLDGELWVGRKQFQETVSIVRRQDGGEHWRRLRFLVFDAPKVDAVFEDRVGWVRELTSAGTTPFAEHVAHVVCEGVDHLRAELARVEGLGGEGLMMRQPRSRYEVGRSATLLKVKTFHDAESRVVAHEPGRGKHKGRVGALVLEMPDGTRFNAGTGLSDEERRNPPPIGAIVTYRYQELSRDGVPRFPSYVGLAVDKDRPTAPTVPAATPAAPVAPEARPAAAPEASTGGDEGAWRRFEMDEKFWAIRLHGAAHTVRFGKLGTNGQEKTKDFPDAAAARRAHDELVGEKTRKGYAEVDG